MDSECAAKAAWNRSRIELPDADPTASATLPVSRLERMLARRQLTGTEFHLAQLFQANPCRAEVLNGYYRVVAGIVLDGKTAEELADPRVGRTKGVAEVMRKLRLGLRLMRDHYLPEDGEKEKYEGYGTPKERTLLAQQAYSAQMHRASAIRQAWRSMPKARRRMLFTGAGADDRATVRARPPKKRAKSLKF